MRRLDAAQQNPYQSAADVPLNPPEEPAANPMSLLTVLGKLNVAIGIMGAFFSIVLGFGWAMAAGRGYAPGGQNEIAFVTFRQWACVVWGILSVGLLVAGVGLQMRRRFGWSLSVISAWLFIILTVTENVVGYVLIKIPELNDVVRLTPGLGGLRAIVQTLLIDIGCLLLVLIYPIALLILLHRCSAVRVMRN